MFCHSCGQKLPDDARFCSKCGKTVASESKEVDLTISEKQREEVYSKLAEVTLNGLENVLITLEQSQDISDFVLDRLDAVKTETQLTLFLRELYNRWPIYKPVCLPLIKESEIRVYLKVPFTRKRK